MTTINPHVDAFLTIYSQSERSTGGTRGYDPETYVETKLDHTLIPTILDSKTKLVLLTGNAGDGKTAWFLTQMCARFSPSRSAAPWEEAADVLVPANQR